MEERNNFDELVFATLTSLNSLIACDELCKDTKAIMRINRFRLWVKELGTNK